MSNQLDRRGFLAAAGAVGTAGAVLSLPDAASAAAVQGSNDRILVGVMGTGGRGTQRRSYAAVIQAIDEMHKGVIGRVYLAQAWYGNNRPTIGRGKEAALPKGLDYELWQGPAPHRPFHNNYLHYNWHWFWHWGNGELGNNGVHSLDICRWGLGVDYPVHVTSSGGRYRYEDDQETPDTHTVCFEFDGKKMITWEGLSCNTAPGGRAFDVIFFGEKG